MPNTTSWVTATLDTGVEVGAYVHTDWAPGRNGFQQEHTVYECLARNPKRGTWHPIHNTGVIEDATEALQEAADK